MKDTIQNRTLLKSLLDGATCDQINSDEGIRWLAQEFKARTDCPDELTAHNGVLQLNGNDLYCQGADIYARRYGFAYAEQFVKFLEKL